MRDSGQRTADSSGGVRSAAAELDERYAMQTYARNRVEFVRGEGCRLWDANGNEYIDLFAGLSVHNAGHCHPAIVAAITAQAGTLGGSSNLFYSEGASRLAERLAESSIGGRVFLCNSGTEANECAIKLVRKAAHARGVERPEIVSLSSAFHGRSMAPLAATPKLAREDLFGPLPAGFVSVDRDDPAALRAVVSERTAAVLIEPIQGEAGIFPISEEVLLAAREACDESGAALVFDEVQTGMGRTGSLWAFEQLGVRPDLITTAKALGGGLPVGACVGAGGWGEVLAPGDHGSTFAGGPIGAAAALAALELIDDPALLREVRRVGSIFCEGLQQIEEITEVRGRGLMVGVTLADGIDSQEVLRAALAERLVINAPGPSYLRFLPPLVITEAELGEALERLRRAITSRPAHARLPRHA